MLSYMLQCFTAQMSKHIKMTDINLSSSHYIYIMSFHPRYANYKVNINE